MRDEYYEFIRKIHKSYGIDLSLYKEAQMKRRITTLRDKRGFKDFTSYYSALSKDKELLIEFIDRLTINVSEFYRNPKRWEVLQKKIIPMLIKNKTNIKVWSAACSSGEEPYSLSIMFKAHFPNVRAQILATDIDEKALLKAREGIYQAQSLKDLPKEYISKYFTKTETGFKINSELQNSITFKKQNLLADPYPRNVDLIGGSAGRVSAGSSRIGSWYSAGAGICWPSISTGAIGAPSGWIGSMPRTGPAGGSRPARPSLIRLCTCSIRSPRRRTSIGPVLWCMRRRTR